MISRFSWEDSHNNDMVYKNESITSNSEALLLLGN